MSAIKPALICAVLCIVFAGNAGAQSNERVDELLAQAQAGWPSTAYIVLVSGALIQEDASPDEAFAKLQELGWFNPFPDASSNVSLQDLSFLVMKTLQMTGGVMYSLFPSPRYAYRELVYLKAAEGARGPERIVSGAEVLRVLTAALDRKAASK